MATAGDPFDTSRTLSYTDVIYRGAPYTEGPVETSSPQSGSDVYFDNICQPCENDGKILEAEGRCEDCDEFLCKRCFLSHTIPSKMRNHVMVDKDQMKQNMTPDKRDQCTQRCPQHNDEILKYYCLEHQFLGCSACMILDHKPCTETLYIPKVAKDIPSSDLYKSYKTSKVAVETKASEITAHTQEKIDTVNRYQTTAVKKMKTFKDEWIDIFERTEKANIKTSERIKTEELDKQKNTQDKSITVSKDIKDISSQVECFESKKQYCNMFIAMVKAKAELKSCDERLGQIDLRDEPPRKVFFIPNTGLNEGLAAGGVGKIVEEPLEVQHLKHERDIDVKTNSDAKTCWITSSATLPDNRVVLADCANKKLKMIDSDQTNIVEELRMPSAPWAVATAGPSEVVVTLPYGKKIAFVKTDGKLAINRKIHVPKCRGVAYTDGKLVVTFEDRDIIDIMDMNGNVLKTIATNTNANESMTEPMNVVTNSFAKSIYVTNASQSSVLCFDNDGSLIATYKDNDLKMPCGMVIDNRGMLYVCDLENQSIHQFSKNGKKVKTLLTQQDVSKPYSICYCDTESKFVIGMRDSSIIKVFKAD